MQNINIKKNRGGLTNKMQRSGNSGYVMLLHCLSTLGYDCRHL